MNTRKAYQNVIVIILSIVSFFSLMGMACDDGPSPDNAYGVTSPVTEVEQAIQNVINPDQQNVLSGGN
jgi:hypothetical protein